MNINDFAATESIIRNKYVCRAQHFNLWKPGKNNVLFITGHSGSGKSSFAEEYEKQQHAIMFELDGLQHDYDSSGKTYLSA